MMRRMLIMATFVFVAASLAGADGCSARNYCNKKAECADEDGDPLEPDSIGVCVANVEGEIDGYFANQEEECLAVGDARQRLYACMATLSCNDFEDSDLGGECDDELDDLDRARDDLNELGSGAFECTALD